MKTIIEMRKKYWSGVSALWPAKSSKVAVQFCWEGFKINSSARNVAQCFFMWRQSGLANYHLTAAYKGGIENEAFWNQFI